MFVAGWLDLVFFSTRADEDFDGEVPILVLGPLDIGGGHCGLWPPGHDRGRGAKFMWGARGF
jgi:hypothetical protein